MPYFLAHQGGWDESLWFAIPVVIVLTWLRWTEKRARHRQTEATEAPTNMPDDVDA